jgi:alpha-galactosidase
VEMVDGLMTEQGIDVYRQDFNIDPLPFWRISDAEDRQGITEIRYVEGYLAFWDELLRRRPGLLIDTCSSGGRRNDLETLRRAVPLLQSDYILEPVSQQNHNYGIAFWIPLHGAGVDHFDAYGFWSCATPALHCHYDMQEKEQDFSSVREMVEQWREIVWPCYWGDYYPLTPYYSENGVWMAWQYHLPEEGRGVLQAFRRKGSADASRSFRLRGLRSDSRYNVRTVGSAEATRTATGEELLADGLRVRISGEPGAVVMAYEEETR